MHGRKQPVFLSLILLVALAPTLARSQSGDGYEPIRPIESRSTAFGFVDQAPLVRYNEYTGNVSIDLSVGVEGLALPIHYSNQSRTLQDVFPLPQDAVMGTRYFGAGWYVGYGVISPSGHEPTHHQINEQDRPTEYDRVLLREPNGAENELRVDLLFQDVPQGDDWYNFHFLDSGLRRLERQFFTANQEIASDTFTLLGADGRRTTFLAREVSVPLGKGFFYPTRIEQSDGRVLTLDYCDQLGGLPGSGAGGGSGGGGGKGGSVCAGSPTPLLKTVSDEWGRSLVLHYAIQPGSGAIVLARVSLRGPGGWDQELGNFEYVEQPYPNQGTKTELRAFITPLGHRTEFHYREQFVTGSMPVNLSEVRLPTGGVVELEYEQVRQLVCPYQWVVGAGDVPAGTPARVRVTRLSYGGETYEYNYQQGAEYGDSWDGSWVVNMRSTPSSVPYHRLTQYFQESVNLTTGITHVTIRCRPHAFPTAFGNKAGRPMRRLEAYAQRRVSPSIPSTVASTTVSVASSARRSGATSLYPCASREVRGARPRTSLVVRCWSPPTPYSKTMPPG